MCLRFFNNTLAHGNTSFQRYSQHDGLKNHSVRSDKVGGVGHGGGGVEGGVVNCKKLSLRQRLIHNM
jgi:hypothetical protein